MNKDIMNALGFTAQVAAVNAGKCPICGKEIKLCDFKDELSRREFKISGMCQVCQDNMFTEPSPLEPTYEEKLKELQTIFTVGKLIK